MIVFDYLTSHAPSLFFHLTHQFHVQLVSFHVVLPNQVYYCYLHFEKQHFEIVQKVKYEQSIRLCKIESLVERQENVS